MYLVISGTNREDSNTIRVAQLYKRLLDERSIPAELLSMVGLNVLERNPAMEEIEKKWLIPAKKFIFISPEYNGSFPGVIKCLFDISRIREVWWDKKALLTGVSTGRAGNLRGMDHLTGILHYLKVVVHPNKLPISVVDTLFDASGNIAHTETLKAIENQLEAFILL